VMCDLSLLSRQLLSQPGRVAQAGGTQAQLATCAWGRKLWRKLYKLVLTGEMNLVTITPVLWTSSSSPGLYSTVS
jgi:hypothetical protein